MPDNFIKTLKILFTIALFFFLSIIFLSKLSTKVFAAPSGVDLWVDGTSGSDPGRDCTDLNNPCASIQWAANLTNPGDTVNVKAGLKIGTDIFITRGGTAKNPIFYRSWPGTGAVNLAGSFRIGDQLTNTPANYIGISGFEISNTVPGGVGVFIWGSDHVLLENLIIHGMDNPVIVQGTVDNIFILNNTIYASGPGSGSTGVTLIPDPIPTSLTIENNIIANATTGIVLAPGSVPPEPVHDYNSFWNNTADYQFISPGAHDIPFDPDPVFFNAAGGDFHTSTTSPVIDAGVTPPPGPDGITPMVTIDINGASRPQGAAYDIGAYEYVPPTPSSSPGLSSAGAPTCGYSAPTDTINLYKIDTTETTAMLYFTPIKDATSYQIFFGYKAGDMRFGGTFPDRPLPYTIDHLSPNTTYYFAVKGENNCAGGKLSNWLSATTGGSSESETSLSSPSPSPTPTGTETIGGGQPTPTPTPPPGGGSFNIFSWITNFLKQLFHF